MKLDTFFEKFDQFADVPGGVAKMRELVLELAVRGKLSEHRVGDSEDTVWLTLTQQLDAETISNTAQFKPPFEIPNWWRWTTLKRLGDTKPRNDAPDDTKSSFVPMTLIPAAYGQMACHEERLWGEIKKGYTHFKNMDVVMAKITPCFENGKSAVMYGLTGGFGAGTTELHVFRRTSEAVLPEFVVIYLKTTGFISRGIPAMTGSAGQKRVPSDYFASSPFPLPPLAEQKRIVAKVDELMALCDRLEAQQKERETRHSTLARASLARFADEPTPANLQFLFHKSYDIKPADLRKSILTLAVRGKLVPQDPDDEPAEVLLESVKAAREALVVERRVRQSDEVEYSLLGDAGDAPRGWVGVHVNDVAVVQGGKRLPSGAVFSESQTPHAYIRVTDMKNGTILETGLRYISPEVQREIARYVINKEDLYITIAGTIGDVGLVPESLDGHNLTENAAKIVFRGFDRLFFQLVLTSEFVQSQFLEKTKQMAQPKLALKRIAGAKFYLPPLAEQRRIVAKVEQLMALVDELEAQLAVSRDAGEKLLAALVVDLTAGKVPNATA